MEGIGSLEDRARIASAARGLIGVWVDQVATILNVKGLLFKFRLCNSGENYG